jgi:hypothetical protein
MQTISIVEKRHRSVCVFINNNNNHIIDFSCLGRLLFDKFMSIMSSQFACGKEKVLNNTPQNNFKLNRFPVIDRVDY